MASGGARARSGPAPDPNALRRDRKDDAQGWTTLPAEGRQGPAPVWPLLGQSEREAELWVIYWAKPQAVLWEHNNQELEVALHVRRLAEVELPDAPTGLGTLVRQQMDALLLTIPAMLSARVRVAFDEVAVKRSAPVAVVEVDSLDEELKALANGQA